VVSDRIGPPTYATDLANAILDIMQNVAFKEAEHQIQVYHYSNEVEISWY
jgi:dTDP-4-dehydrorhamnose reductase